MVIDENTVRWDLVSQIDEGIRSWSPDELEGERDKFFETILEWLERWVDSLDIQSVDLETHECDDPRRYLITMEGDRGYVVNIHDPMQGGVGSAESVTGADYSVQYPTGPEEERFLFVQAKRDNYPVKPKQYFAFGGLYMFLQYIVKSNWWRTRLKQEGEYVTKRGKPHQEPFFISVYFNDDDEEVYIPLSSILRTFGKSTYGVKDQLSKKDRLWVAKHTGPFAEFSNTKQHLAPLSRSFDDFVRAAERGSIGMTHLSTVSVTERKMEGVLYLAEATMRPNVNIIEMDLGEIGTYVDTLTQF
ncbi:hypothetical protein [Halosimplex halobium]|uniref:hypothetical protein n=1 Tax=Halosimplex halobium TaxID=3396618 RepID=UPI003F57A2AC